MSLIHFKNKYYLDIDIECTDGWIDGWTDGLVLLCYLNFLEMKLTNVNLNFPCMHTKISILNYYYYVSIRKYFTFYKETLKPFNIS